MFKKKAPFKVIIKGCDLPLKQDFENELKFLCQSFGFFEDIDRSKTAFNIFKEIIIATEKDMPLTSTELAKKVCMSRGSVINHLNNLHRSGLVIKQGRFYLSRCKSLSLTIEEVEADIERIFKRMKLIAKKLDKELGIESEF